MDKCFYLYNRDIAMMNPKESYIFEAWSWRLWDSGSVICQLESIHLITALMGCISLKCPIFKRSCSSVPSVSLFSFWHLHHCYQCKRKTKRSLCRIALTKPELG